MAAPEAVKIGLIPWQTELFKAFAATVVGKLSTATVTNAVSKHPAVPVEYTVYIVVADGCTVKVLVLILPGIHV